MHDIKKLLLLTLMVIAVITPLSIAQSPIDRTEQIKKKGEDVVLASIDKIRTSKIFKDDHDFLRRVAYAESKFGDDEDTYPVDYFGGIWKVNEAVFLVTKNTTAYPSLADKHDKIFSSKVFNNLEWAARSTRWARLQRPIASALAARLYISTIEEDKSLPIPQTIQEQAKYWIDHYTKQPDVTEETFITAVAELDALAIPNVGKLDIIVMLDGSASVQEDQFEEALNFVADLFSSFSHDNVRKGFITFRRDAKEELSLTNNLTAEEITDQIVDSTNYDNSTGIERNTNDGITKAVEAFAAAPARPGVPKVLIVVTVGKSNKGGANDDGGIPDIEFAKAANIITYAIGIGSEIDETELSQFSQDEPNRVFKLNEFAALSDLHHRLNRDISNNPLIASEETSEVTEFVVRNETRYYELVISPQGLTVNIVISRGRTQNYYSYLTKNPSTAMYDGRLTESMFFPGAESGDKNLFLAVKGVAVNNNYLVQVQSENHVPTTTQQPDPTTEPAEPTTEPAEPTTTEPAEPTTGPAEPTTEPAELTTEPAEPTTEPAEPTTEPAEPTTEPAEPTTEPAEPTTEPAEPTTEPAEPTTEPAEPTTEPAEPTTEPAEPITEPAEPTTEPAEPTTEPAEPITEPAEPTTEPAEPTTEPAEPTTEPAEPTTDPAEPTTEPAESTTEPAEPTTDPAEPTTEPAEPTTDPAEPTTEPAESTTEPAEPTTDPAEPTTEPAESTPEPADPTTEPADATTEPIETTTEPADLTTDPIDPGTGSTDLVTESEGTTTDPGTGSTDLVTESEDTTTDPGTGSTDLVTESEDTTTDPGTGSTDLVTESDGTTTDPGTGSTDLVTASEGTTTDSSTGSTDLVTESEGTTIETTASSTGPTNPPPETPSASTEAEPSTTPNFGEQNSSNFILICVTFIMLISSRLI